MKKTRKRDNVILMLSGFTRDTSSFVEARVLTLRSLILSAEMFLCFVLTMFLLLESLLTAG